MPFQVIGLVKLKVLNPTWGVTVCAGNTVVQPLLTGVVVSAFTLLLHWLLMRKLLNP